MKGCREAEPEDWGEAMIRGVLRHRGEQRRLRGAGRGARWAWGHSPSAPGEEGGADDALSPSPHVESWALRAASLPQEVSPGSVCP